MMSIIIFSVPLALVNIMLCWLYLRGVIAIFNWIENGKTSASYSDVSLSKMNVDSPKDNADQQDDNADPPTVFVSAMSTVDNVDSEVHAEDIKSIVNKHLKVMTKHYVHEAARFRLTFLYSLEILVCYELHFEKSIKNHARL